MVAYRDRNGALVPKGTGLNNLDSMLLESARKELAYHMGEFKKSGDDWHREKARRYRVIVRNLQTKEIDNAATS